MKFSLKSSTNLESIGKVSEVDVAVSVDRGVVAIEEATTTLLEPKTRNWFLTAAKSKHRSSDRIIFKN